MPKRKSSPYGGVNIKQRDVSNMGFLLFMDTTTPLEQKNIINLVTLSALTHATFFHYGHQDLQGGSNMGPKLLSVFLGMIISRWVTQHGDVP